MVIEAAPLGREQESAAVGRFLATIEERPAAVVLEGEPGIGKTALVAHAVGEARRRGFRILEARPTSAESSLSFVGLTDLLSDAHPFFAELPLPQRRALEVALLLDELTDMRPDPRAIGLGLLGVLRALAASSPVVVAIDDLQWLDAASASALSFALRRVTAERIGLLAAMRADAEPASGELTRSLRSERLALGPLSVGAIHALLAERLQLSIPRSLLLRIHEGCRGNPLFALEIGRSVRESGVPEPGQPFEIPSDAETLFAVRLEQLPDDTLDALAVAAATAAPTLSFVGAVSGGALEPAIRADVILLEGERIHFTHPLIASAVSKRLRSPVRSELHRRIAAAVTDREERARHLALAAEAPDDDVAAALDEAAEQAARRGAPAAAAELAELAVKLTPEDDVDRRHARQHVAARHHYIAGDVPRSRAMLERLVDELPAGARRARALEHLAETHSGNISTMMPLREQAAAEAVGDDHVLAGVLPELARTWHVSGDPVRGLTLAREAVAAAERDGDVEPLVPALAFLSWLEMWNGVAPGRLEEALTLAQQAGYLRFAENHPSTVEGCRLMLQDNLDAARVRFAAAEALARDHGDDDVRAVVLMNLTRIESRAGHFDAAAGYATESCDLRLQLGLGVGPHLYFVALAEALRGHAEEAAAAAEQGRALCEQTGNELYTVRNLHVLGLLALSSGDASKAARILAPLPDRLETNGYRGFVLLDVLPDAIEALIAVGDVDRAAAHLELLDELTRTLGTAYARARAARCRGLHAAAERDHTAAFKAFEVALAAHEQLPDPLERGRTLLALGQTLRRAGRRRDARESLREALTVFDEIGAALWAEQAHAELRRLGGRTASANELTGAEERVARLVAAGKTNREVAAALFVTEGTVETHLSSVYRKLDLRSRTELASHLARGSS
jgi:DNA-binding CsgD family transcriptional regulator